MDVQLKAAQSTTGDSSMDVILSEDADDELGMQPTLVRKGSDPDSGSDSDVKLIFDDSMNVAGPKSGIKPEDSDSDVKLAGGAAAAGSDSDSDVKLAGSAEAAEAGSDSDVKLIGDDSSFSDSSGGGSDSDVRLVSSDSSGEVKIARGPGDSSLYPGKSEDAGATIDLAPASQVGGSVLDDDEASGISLGEGSSNVLSTGSGISLDRGKDSGIALASDSGISLEQPNDSGISLSEESSLVLAEDSGISLADEPGKRTRGGKPATGKKPGKAKGPGDSDDLTGTVPLMQVPLAQDEDLLETQEVPLMSDDSSDRVSTGSGSATGVVTLDDDETDTSQEAEVLDALEDEEVDFSDAAPVDEDELLGEDDEVGEAVFAEEADFGEVESGESLVSAAPRAMAAPVESEWGAGTFAGLTVSAVLMVACGTVMFDLVRSMWHATEGTGNPVASMLLETLKGM
jgi:hypothetical protein